MIQNKDEKQSEIKSEATPPKTHGGARENSGRKPKALRHAQEIAAAEGKIVAALPRLIESLIVAAENGSTSAAKYLLDRVFGRVANAALPIAEDIGMPMDNPMAYLFAQNFGGLRIAAQTGELFATHPKVAVEVREMAEASISPEAQQAWFKKRQQSEVSLKQENEKLKAVVNELIQQTNTQSEPDDEDDPEENEDPEYRQAAE